MTDIHAAREILHATQTLRQSTHQASGSAWTATPDILIGGWAVAKAPLTDPEGPYLANFVHPEDAEYIALMSPETGNALVTLLDTATGDSPLYTQVLAIARAINGGILCGHCYGDGYDPDDAGDFDHDAGMTDPNSIGPCPHCGGCGLEPEVPA
jgi:hypothetical protein